MFIRSYLSDPLNHHPHQSHPKKPQWNVDFFHRLDQGAKVLSAFMGKPTWSQKLWLALGSVNHQPTEPWGLISSVPGWFKEKSGMQRFEKEGAGWPAHTILKYIMIKNTLLYIYIYNNMVQHVFFPSSMYLIWVFIHKNTSTSSIFSTNDHETSRNPKTRLDFQVGCWIFQLCM